MLDFMTIATRSPKRGEVEIYPKFIIKKSKDLMIRGQDFYAIWDEERKLWSTDEEDVVRLIDQEIKTYYEENKTLSRGLACSFCKFRTECLYAEKNGGDEIA